MKKLLFASAFALAALMVSAADFSMDGDPNSKTEILSETLEMISTDEENIFYFTNNVRANGTNLSMTSEQVVVRATRAPSEGANDLPDVGSIGTIKNIVATGNVVIVQDGRKATAGRAEFFPKEGKVVLTEDPRVIDSKAIVSGWRITLVQGERRVKVEQDPNGTQRPSVNLSQIPDMGYDRKAAEEEEAKEKAADEAQTTIAPAATVQ